MTAIMGVGGQEVPKMTESARNRPSGAGYRHHRSWGTVRRLEGSGQCGSVAV